MLDDLIKQPLKLSTKLDTKLSKFYEFNSSNWVGEIYPSEECILLRMHGRKSIGITRLSIYLSSE
jgi:hypothetical protein